MSLITGASSGIGKATALLFAKEGSKVVIADVKDKEGEEVVNEIRKNGGDAMYVHTDVSRSEDVRNAVESAVKKYGRLDVMYNNAGIEGPSSPTDEYPEDMFDKVISINMKGAFNGIKHASAQMKKNGGGSIISTASIAGLVGFSGMSAYCASKGGIIQLTKTAALEFAKDNIRINCIAPGAIHTPMVDRIGETDKEMMDAVIKAHPLGRLGEPEEIAKTALYLASADSSFTTGSVMVVDGGYVTQ